MSKEAKRLMVDTFSPEFAAYWHSGPEEAGAGQGTASAGKPDSLSASQQLALEELVERIAAARSVA